MSSNYPYFFSIFNDLIIFCFLRIPNFFLLFSVKRKERQKAISLFIPTLPATISEEVKVPEVKSEPQPEPQPVEKERLTIFNKLKKFSLLK